MRGKRNPQATMLAFVDMEERVPHDRPIRTIKVLADEALERLSPESDRMYAQVGRASMPPERPLNAIAADQPVGRVLIQGMAGQCLVRHGKARRAAQ